MVWGVEYFFWRLINFLRIFLTFPRYTSAKDRACRFWDRKGIILSKYGYFLIKLLMFKIDVLNIL